MALRERLLARSRVETSGRERKPRHGAREPLRIDGLDQVVERAHLEGPEREFVIGRREDHERHRVERREEIEARLARHLHVEEEELRLQILERLPGGPGVRGLADDLDLGILAEETAELVSREALVVHDESFHRGTVSRSGFVSTAGAREERGILTSQVTSSSPDCT